MPRENVNMVNIGRESTKRRVVNVSAWLICALLFGLLTQNLHAQPLSGAFGGDWDHRVFVSGDANGNGTVEPNEGVLRYETSSQVFQRDEDADGTPDGIRINGNRIIQWDYADPADGNFWREVPGDPNNGEVGDPDWTGGDHPGYQQWVNEVQRLLDLIDTDGDGTPNNADNDNNNNHTVADYYPNANGNVPAGALNIPDNFENPTSQAMAGRTVDNGGIVTYVRSTEDPYHVQPGYNWDIVDASRDNELVYPYSIRTDLDNTADGKLTIVDGAALTFRNLKGIVVTDQRKYDALDWDPTGEGDREREGLFVSSAGGTWWNYGESGGAINIYTDDDSIVQTYTFTQEGQVGNGILEFINNSAARWGGAIANNQHLVLDVTNALFENNEAGEAGGAINNLHLVDINKYTRFTNNTARVRAGAFYNGGTLTVSNGSLFQGNQTLATLGNDIGGGAIYNAGHLDLNSTGRYNEFLNNRTSGKGGAIYMGDRSTASIDWGRFGRESGLGNTAGDGGAIYNLGTLIISGESYFSSNYASQNTGSTGSGGAIYSYGNQASLVYTDTDLTGMIMRSNSAYHDGGAIYNHLGDITLENVLFDINTAGSDGGAIFSNSATLNLTNADFNHNVAAGDGDNIYIAADNAASITNMFVTAGRTVGFRGLGDSIFFQNTHRTHTLNIEVAKGGELNMELPMIGGNNVTIDKQDITTTGNAGSIDGLGIWRLGGATTLGTNAKVNITEGTLELLNGATMTLGTSSNQNQFELATGTMTPNGIGVENELTGGAILFSNGGNTITADYINLGTTNTILGFEGISLNTSTASLTLVSRKKPLELGNGQILIEGDINSLDDGVILADLGSGAEVDMDNFKLYEGTYDAWEEYQVNRSTLGTAKGLFYDEELNQIRIEQVNAGTNTVVYWTAGGEQNGNGQRVWNVGDVKNWAGWAAGGSTDVFLENDTVRFIDDNPAPALAADRKITLGEDITVGDMFVTGTNYVFDLNNKNLTAAANAAVEAPATGKIDFGTAQLINLRDRTITAADTITFKDGSKLDFDVTGQADGARNLTINAGTANGITFEKGTEIRVAGSPLTAGQTIILIDTNQNNTFANVAELELFTDPTKSGTFNPATAVRSEIQGEKMAGLATNADNMNQLLYKQVNADANSSDLQWTGVQSLSTTTNSRWVSGNTDTNWGGTVDGLGVKTFLNGDNVTFGDTYGTSGTTVDNKMVTFGGGVPGAVVTAGQISVSGTGYTFDFQNANPAGTTLQTIVQTAGMNGATVTSDGHMDFGDATIANLGTNDKIIAEGDITLGNANGNATFTNFSGGEIESGGNISFGKANLEVSSGKVTAVGDITFDTDSVLNFDLTNASTTDPLFELSGNKVTVNSSITLSNLDAKAATMNVDDNVGDTITLIDIEPDAAAVLTNNNKIIVGEGTNAALFDRKNNVGGGLMFGLRKDDNDSDLVLVALNAAGAFELVWNGEPTDLVNKNNVWNSESTNKNWGGTSTDGGVTLGAVEFVNNDLERDSVTFGTSGHKIVDINNGTNGTIYVDNMVVEDSGYRFDFNLSNGTTPVIDANTVTLAAGTTFNITGITLDEDKIGERMVLIESASIISGTPMVEGGGDETPNFISITMDSTTPTEVAAIVDLSWRQEGPGSAQGTFTLENAEDEFTLNVNLGDNDVAASHTSGWDGTTLTKDGAGTLILAGNNNTYSGETIIQGGTLQVTGALNGTSGIDITGAGSALEIAGNGTVNGSPIDIANAGAALKFNITGSRDITNAITGNGNVEVNAGTVTFSGDKLYGGTTTVAAGGALYMNGINRTSGVDVSGTFGGTGTLERGNMVVHNGGVFTPGGANAYSNFTVNGDVTFENGSEYYFEYDNRNSANARGDLLTVGADSQVIINSGARLNVQLEGDAKLGDRILVIDADFDQFVNGAGALFTATGDAAAFDVAGNFGTQFRQLIDEENGGYWLTWAPVSPDFEDRIPNMSPNAGKAAEGVDKIAAQATDNGTEDVLYANRVYDALTSFSDDATGQAAIAKAFEQLHGEVYATSRFAAAQMQRNFQELMPTGREILKTGNKPKISNLWGTLTGEMEARDNIGKYSGYEMSSTGFAAGYDRMVSANYLIGAAIGYDLAHLNFDTINSKAQIDALRTMLYSSWYNGTYHLDMYGGYSKNFNETERNIRFADFSAATRGEYNDDVATAGFELGRTSWYDQMFSLTPSIGMHYIRVISPDVTETEGNGAELFVAGDDFQSLRMPIGVKVSGVLTGEKGTAGTVWVPEARIFYVREWLDDEAVAMTSFNDFRNTSFAAMSGKQGKDSGLFGVGLNVQFTERWQLRFDYDFAVYQHMNTHAFSGTLGVHW